MRCAFVCICWSAVHVLLLIISIDPVHAFVGELKSVVTRAVESSHRRLSTSARPEGERLTPITSLSSTTAFQARNVPTTPHEVNPNVVAHGLRFVLREDNRCFIVEVDRPGDHVMCSFRYQSNLTDDARRMQFGKNVTVEWFSPTGASAAVFHFHPQHACAKKGRCLVRATPVRSESLKRDTHGVISGAYTLCFRMSSQTFLSRILTAFSRVSNIQEEVEVELLELNTAPLVPVRAERGVEGQSRRQQLHVREPSKPTSTLVGASQNRRSPLEPLGTTAKRITSFENRLRLINLEIDSILTESRHVEERQRTFGHLVHALFTRIWICGAGTIAVTVGVLWAQTTLLKRHLVKRKLV